LSLVGAAGEESGDYFPELLKNIEAIPFLRKVSYVPTVSFGM
jgi:hypothetical protein